MGLTLQRVPQGASAARMWMARMWMARLWWRGQALMGQRWAAGGSSCGIRSIMPLSIMPRVCGVRAHRMTTCEHDSKSFSAEGARATPREAATAASAWRDVAWTCTGVGETRVRSLG